MVIISSQPIPFGGEVLGGGGELMSAACLGSNNLRMKRQSESCTPPGAKALIVRLNVGGQIFATSTDTLRKCAYFEPFLSGRILHGSDENGCFFLDRSPELFKVVGM